MKCFAVRIMLVLGMTIFLNSCASSEDQFGNASSSSSAQTVPGEKASGGAEVMPAAGAGAGAKVGW
jgi:hypothetical protein